MAYRELMEMFEISTTQSDQIITRYYVDVDNFTIDAGYDVDDIPQIGDTFAVSDLENNPYLSWVGAIDNASITPHVISIKMQPFKYQSNEIYAFIVTYGITPPEDTRIDQTLSVGGEWMVLDSDGGKSTTKFVQKKNEFVGYVKKWITTADYTYSSVFNTIDEALKYNETSYFSDIVGYVKQLYVTDGVWLLAGYNIEEIVSRDATVKYRRTEVYKYRKIMGDMVDGPGGMNGGWNLVWNQKYALFNTTEPLTYETTTSWPRSMPFDG